LHTFFSLLKAFFRNKWIKALLFILCLAAAFSLGVFVTYKVAVNPIALFQTESPTATPEPTEIPPSYVTVPSLTDKPTSNPDTAVDTDENALNSGIVNILIIGADYSPEREDWEKNYYSDVMLVLAIDFENNKVDMISVPRDTFAPIYNTPGIYKLNSALYHGGGVDGDGFNYVVKSVENVMGGINIDYYMGVNMTAVKSLVDAIGGVDYDVDVTVKMQGRVINKGYQHMDGQDVLDYCRARKGIDNDIGRVGRQKKIMVAIFEQLQESNLILEVPGIINALKDEVYTNMSFDQFCALAIFGKNLDKDNIGMHTVEGHFLQIFNWSMYVLDDEERIALIEQVYGFTAEPLQEASQKYAKLTWAIIQAEGTIDIVNSRMNSSKVSSANRGWLKKKIDIVQRAIEGGDRVVIETQTQELQSQAGAVFAAAGISTNWYINENPGKERMTG
jgi:LCP family protein required for cell wall assembly